MDQSPFFTVVMPIYCAEEYLGTAVECILKQTFRDFELLLVDDGSTDQSGRIADDFMKEDSRVRVLHHDKNRGQSAARNTGIDCAKGQYILFFDADDEAEEYLLAEVYNSLMRNPARLVVYGLKEEYYNKVGKLEKSYEFKAENKYLTNKHELRKVIIELERKTLYGYPWNKCYDLPYMRKLGIRFEDAPLLEDIVFNIQYCMDIDTLNTLSMTPYHYKKRNNDSLTGKFVMDYYKLHCRRIRLLLKQYQYWEMCDCEIKCKLANIYVRYIYSALERNFDKRAGMSLKQQWDWCRKLYHDSLFHALIPYASDKRVIYFVMIKMLKKRFVWGAWSIAALIHIIKSRMYYLFVALKSPKGKA